MVDLLIQIKGEKMKLIKLSFICLMIIFISSVSNAQLLKLGVGGGITQVTGPEGYTNDVSNDGAGFSTEWNFAIQAKLDLPIVPITPRAFFMYHSLSGSGEVPTSGLGKGLNINDVTDYSQTITSIGIGAQFNFIPVPVGIDPYIGLDLAMNSFGRPKINDEEIPNTESNSRVGLGIGVGAEISIVPKVNLDLNVSYQLFNLAGKDDGEETISAITLDAFIIFGLL